MAKKKNNTGIFIGIAIIIAALILAPNLNFEFFSTTTNIDSTTQNKLDTQEAGDCYATLDKSVVNVGDEVGGVIHDGKNTLCEVYATDGITWVKIAEGTTNSNGDLRFMDTINIPGTFTFRVICGACITKAVTLQVNPLAGDCTDTDGGNVRTVPGHVTLDGVSYYDYCLDVGDAVHEYWCDGNFMREDNYMCDYDEHCVATRSGGYCAQDVEEGYNVGDEVFYYGKSLDSLDGGYSVELHLDDADIETGGPCHLGARIFRSWDYLVPGCDGSVGTVDWTLFDSSGFRWGVYDTSPTSQTVEVCPCSWDGVTNWYFEVVNTKSPNCPIEFEYAFTIYVCECD
ncbi:MAG: hypothetical protein KKB31_05700 [Nanoarchaeota archaeon]|nr:hypothetical protein [Nanoarchaeota archaeon]